MATKQRMIRLDVYVKRHPSLSVDEFHRKWSGEHASLLRDWLSRNAIHRYTQFHTPPEMQIQAEGASNLLEFDGHAECLMDDMSCLKRLVEDPYYKEVIEPHEKTLIDISSAVRVFGYEEVWVRDGKPTE